MVYQGDTYTFALFLGRKQTTTISISSVSTTSGVSTYTYELVSGPPLELGTAITVSGMSSVNNVTQATITFLSPLFDSLGFQNGVTFKVSNPSGTTEIRSGTGIVSTLPNVTTAPTIQIVQLSTLTGMLSPAGTMIATDGTKQCWSYTWSIGSSLSGQYVAIASYVVDGCTFNSQPIEKLTVGDTRVTGPVALASLTALDATVAKDSTVAHFADLASVDPDTSAVVLSIQNKVNNLPVDPAGMTLLSSYLSNIIDLHDAALGNQIIDKTHNPPIYTMNRVGGGVLQTFTITDSANQTTRISQ